MLSSNPLATPSLPSLRAFDGDTSNQPCKYISLVSWCQGKTCRNMSMRPLPSFSLSPCECGWGHRLWLDLERGAASCKAQEIGGGGGLRGKMQKDNRAFSLLSSATPGPKIGVGRILDRNSLWPLLKSSILELQLDTIIFGWGNLIIIKTIIWLMLWAYYTLSCTFVWLIKQKAGRQQLSAVREGNSPLR